MNQQDSCAMRNEKTLMSLPLLMNGYQLDEGFCRSYELEDQIGSGGYGFVMSAVHRETKKAVAVKFIYKYKLPLQTNANNTPNEITILKQINHPTVIKYIDSFQDDVYHYLVMELYGCEWSSAHQTPKDSHSEDSSSCESDAMPPTPPTLWGSCPIGRRRTSCDLFECIESHTKLNVSHTQSIIKQLVQCMSDLSDLGIYHRDIKDENIVVDSNFQIKLVDFGSAIQIPFDFPNHQYTINEFHGTISFASPEILLGLDYRPEPAEVWSLGVLLFTLLYGQSPFVNSTQVISGNWKRPKAKEPNGPDDACLDLLNGMLKNNPQQRLSIKEVLHHPWLNV